MTRERKNTPHLLTAFLALTLCVHAPTYAQDFNQEAPAPSAAPTMSVDKKNLLDDNGFSIPREVMGKVQTIKADTLKLGTLDLKLFGIAVPPQSLALYEKTTEDLNAMTMNQIVVCHLRTRNPNGSGFLATCYNGQGKDLAAELLQKGLAIPNRKAVTGTELAKYYFAAAAHAQNKKLGLWVYANAPTVKATQTTNEPVLDNQAIEANESKSETPRDTMAEVPIPPSQSPPVMTTEKNSFLATNQILLASLVFFFTCLGAMGLRWAQRYYDRKAETRAIAAALYGELDAARALCLNRAISITAKKTTDASWPALRTSIYQAYIGKLGWLGSDLARNIATIYAKAHDYQTPEHKKDHSPDMQALCQGLSDLANHISKILPHLQQVEHLGSAIAVSKPFALNLASPAPAIALPPMTPSWDNIRNFMHSHFPAPRPHTDYDELPALAYADLLEQDLGHPHEDDLFNLLTEGDMQARTGT